MNRRVITGIILLVVALIIFGFGDFMFQPHAEDVVAPVEEVEGRQTTGSVLILLAFILGVIGVGSLFRSIYKEGTMNMKVAIGLVLLLAALLMLYFGYDMMQPHPDDHLTPGSEIESRQSTGTLLVFASLAAVLGSLAFLVTGARQRQDEFVVYLSVRNIVISGILAAITILLGLTGLGFIPIPFTPVTNATVMHVPVILGGVLEGPLVGLITGGIFGLFSFLRAADPLLADPLIAILPRLFIGVTAFLAYTALKNRNLVLACAVAGVVGSLTNTILVLGMGVIRGILVLELAVYTGLTHGLAEAALAAICTVILVTGIQRVRRTEAV